ncbi:YjbH domain-containing protein [Salipiger mucosus]|uniref:Putative outer membrane lipoprotein n=1 Tax=Salipiger mucosus DSM 16094 TaxID=1123237 RepID=S9RC16_9RHOB|nr:YjbH domain-containing protein [Salipiger mucosus]EPX75635.1 Putative outer membrane lipoprotein [Salipiger mucosus DSM 16094]
MKTHAVRFTAALCLLPIGAQQAVPQERVWTRPTLNFMGVPGLIDMPTGHQMQDADLSLSLGGFEKTRRATLHFQITPRLSGVFRYVNLEGYNQVRDQYYDRSFDLRYLLMEETARRPAVSVGLQDFGGTGIYAGEYVAATKTFGRLRATGGLGWGRFGSFNGIRNPLAVLDNRFEDRADQSGGISETGQLDADQWFQGDAAFFGGLQYRVNDKLTLTAEYSSDAYEAESENIGFDRESPLNFGATWRFDNGVSLTGAYLYGSTVAVNLSYTFNPKSPGTLPGGTGRAPLPVTVRPAGAAGDLGWTQRSGVADTLQTSVSEALADEGLLLDAISVSAREAEVRFRNPTYMNGAQALGRAARVLSRLPPSIETIALVPVTASGLPVSRVIVRRGDLEELEHAPDGSWQMFARAGFEDAHPVAEDAVAPEGRFPIFRWGVGPYLSSAIFDPDEPFRIDGGIEVSASFEPTPGLVFSGAVRHRLAGNVEDLPASNSVLPRVRSEVGLYAQEGETALTNLTAARYFRPGKDFYGRVTAGYLEPMFGGLSGELLWKPVDSRIGVGLEMNYARKRAYDQGFDFQDYDILTGHLSTYVEGRNGFQYQVDAGRYLAGDWGATLSVGREFDNGVRLGAFATFTDVSFDDFGEGSFDKGFRIEIPLSIFSGQPSKETLARTVRPTQRDGGARLSVPGRLYESVRGYHRSDLQSEWGRFWR